MANTTTLILKGIGRYLLGAIIVFALFIIFFKKLSHEQDLVPLLVFGTLGLPFLFVWRFWKGGLISIIILGLIYGFLKSGISVPSGNPESICINESKAKRIIGDYYDERFAAQSVTWFSNQWRSEKNSDGTVNVTAYYNADYCQPACKEIFEVGCDGTYRLIGTDFSTNPNTEN
jgi:hypothetical protein